MGTRVPRFFFHVRERRGTTPDTEGMDLPDRDAALDVALAGARSILCEEVMGGRLSLDGAIDVTDADGNKVMTLSFAEAVALPADQTDD
jgi:hypothetical protein